MLHKDGSPWKERLNQQVMPIHVAAFYLQPQHYDAVLTQRS